MKLIIIPDPYPIHIGFIHNSDGIHTFRDQHGQIRPLQPIQTETRDNRNYHETNPSRNEKLNPNRKKCQIQIEQIHHEIHQYVSFNHDSTMNWSEQKNLNKSGKKERKRMGLDLGPPCPDPACPTPVEVALTASEWRGGEGGPELGQIRASSCRLPSGSRWRGRGRRDPRVGGVGEGLVPAP